MKRDEVDLHEVPLRQVQLHDRLRLNWTAYCHGSNAPQVSPMFRDYRPERELVYNPPEPKRDADLLDGARLNKAITALPEKHRHSLQWFYIKPCHPRHPRKALGVTLEGLHKLVQDARDMLRNRGA